MVRRRETRPDGGCSSPDSELLLNALLGGLVQEGHIAGSAINAGAADGELACFLATLGSLVVHAIDPDASNIMRMERRFPQIITRRRLVPLLGALGDLERPASQGAPSGIRVAKAQRLTTPFPTFTVDALFASRWRNESLGLLHLDVEGFEPRALAGAQRTLQRDAPIVATEVTVHRFPETTRRVLEMMANDGYASFLIEEIAGQRADIRNLLHLPRHRWQRFEQSHVLTLAIASRTLIPVDATSVEQYAFPCCRRGAECCLGRNCCSHASVQRFLSRALTRGGADLQFYTRTTWYDAKWMRVLPSFEPMLRLQRQSRNRSVAQAGFSYFRFRKGRGGRYEPARA